MKLSVASNFDNELLIRSKDFPVLDFFGKLPQDVIGGGRSRYMIAPISRREFEQHVACARENGFGFNYLLNAACLNNLETSRKGQKQIRNLLKWMVEIGVTATTVANPLLLRIIKELYPQLKVRVSVFACVDHASKAVYWEKNGADIICLDSLTMNRDLAALKSIRKAVKIDLELLANGNCLQSCSLCHTHMNLLAHSSQEGHDQKGFVIDHCMLECSKAKVKDPVNFIRSDWIRPEDLHLYQALGYNHFKLGERNLPTSIMMKRIEAYSTRTYDGNLIDLIQPYGHGDTEESRQHYSRGKRSLLQNFLRPGKVNIPAILKLKDLTDTKGMLTPLAKDAPVYIDNSQLNGFLEEVWKRKCRYHNCEECLFCHEMAEKAVNISPDYKTKCLSLHRDIESSLLNGSMWGRFNKTEVKI
jgi:collagenase-like PrtC family protease